MKKIISSIKTLAALFVAGAAMTACTNDELVEPANTTKTYTLTVNASKGGDGGQTRAINLDGKTLNATWATGETVYVKKSGSDVGTLSPDADGVSTMLKGTLTGEFAIGNTLDLTFPRATVDYSGQVGTLSEIAEKYDYATATATISSISGSTITADNGSGEAVEFENQQAIVKFTLLQSDGSALPSNPTSVSISYGTGSVSLTSIPAATYTTNGNGVLYIAIPGFSGQDVIVTAAVGSTAYTFKQSNVTFINGKYYAIGVRMTENTDLATPLTFEAKEAGTVVTFSSTMDVVPNIEYSTDGDTWTSYSEAITLTNIGDKVSFRGDNATYATNIINYSYRKSHFSCSSKCYIYGNIMSLISSTDYPIATALTNDYTFMELFRDNSNLLNHPSKKLVLPATTLTDWCYLAMFYGTGLTTAPELPATTLAEGCYGSLFQECTSLTTASELPATILATNCYCGMFLGCSSLTTAPELPNITLAEDCYRSMFEDCTSLTTAPELPATTMTDRCYLSMFKGCTSLTTAPELPATTLAEECYERMFFGCTSLTASPSLLSTTLATRCYSGMFYACTNLNTAPSELPAMTLSDYCYYEMFKECTSLTTAPVLPATTLTTSCYEDMFRDCTNLNSVKCLATDNIRSGINTTWWLKDVAESGTFTKAASATRWPTGADGIPEGWTVINE